MHVEGIYAWWHWACSLRMSSWVWPHGAPYSIPKASRNFKYVLNCKQVSSVMSFTISPGLRFPWPPFPLASVSPGLHFPWPQLWPLPVGLYSLTGVGLLGVPSTDSQTGSLRLLWPYLQLSLSGGYRRHPREQLLAPQQPGVSFKTSSRGSSLHLCCGEAAAVHSRA